MWWEVFVFLESFKGRGCRRRYCVNHIFVSAGFYYLISFGGKEKDAVGVFVSNGTANNTDDI